MDEERKKFLRQMAELLMEMIIEELEGGETPFYLSDDLKEELHAGIREFSFDEKGNCK